MVPHTLFISDLHLDESRPAATEAALRFLATEAAEASALYILGDLFEYWIGDDARMPMADDLAEALSSLQKNRVPCYFVHGNRDFLVGPDYAHRTGMELLGDETVIDLHGVPTLLMHGDQLCTDDEGYQAIRRMVREPAWQADFLARSPAERIAFAQNARQQSADYKKGQSEKIMDVNADAVEATFERHGVRRLIHGHTHRPAVHDLPAGRQRIVLGDWYEQGSVLKVSAQGAELRSIAFGQA